MGAIIFIALILGANFVMFVIARNWAQGGDSRWMSALKDGLSKPLENKTDKSMDELRKKMEELKKNNEKEE